MYQQTRAHMNTKTITKLNNISDKNDRQSQQHINTKTKNKTPNPLNMSAIYNMFSSCLHCFKLSYFEYLEKLKEYKL